VGATGVPFFVIDGAFAISGAQPAETILAGLRHAHAAAVAEDHAGAGSGTPTREP
jgi:predicted DsbA family dithiol-disulfide isomerase